MSRILTASLIFASLLLTLSCGKEKHPRPYTVDEAALLAREIRLNSIKPDKWVLDQFKENEVVTLVDTRGYSGGLEVLKYLVPLLHSEGIVQLDLWFIPEDGLVQANALLNGTLFYADSAADLSGRAGYLYLYEEHLDFLRYLYDFNSTLEEGEDRLILTKLTGEEAGGLVYTYEIPQNGPALLIQNPPALSLLDDEDEGHLLNRIEQVFEYLEGEEPFFVLGTDHFFRTNGENSTPLLILSEPGRLPLCHPLKKGINKSNYEEALSDFPNQHITAPAFLAIRYMKKAQKKYLRALSKN
ncbi:MAG: hypothetical protein PQJ59_06565 [Spirochaetales bacterium]|nr:hypothetical protein [Spirochaetales bacterium]